MCWAQHHERTTFLIGTARRPSSGSWLQFQEKPHILFAANNNENCHGRDILWEGLAKEVPVHIKENLRGSPLIVALITDTVKAGGQHSLR